MSTLVTGARVKLPDPLAQCQVKYALGTVVEVPEESIPKDRILICLDLPGPGEYNDRPDIVGEHYGLVTRIRALRSPGPFDNEEAKYVSVPQHVGMFNPEPFKYDGMKFPSHSLGRVLQVHQDRTTLQWLNVLEGQRFTVPTDHLRWCRFDPKTNKIKKKWYTSKSAFAKGDILVYWSDKPHRMSSDPGSSGYPHVLTRGVLLQFDGGKADFGYVRASVVAGLSTQVVGTEVQLRKQDVKKYEKVFIPAGKQVEIIVEVAFKKRSLQGRRGRVVLATDYEGDVGIEFPEDIGAGSLDGAGLEGRCLYVPTEAVSEVPE